MPDWLLDLLTANESNSSQQVQFTGDIAPGSPPAGQFAPNPGSVILPGKRNEKLFNTACAMVGRGTNFTAVAAEIEKINSLKCTPPLGETEIQKIIKNAFRYAPNHN